MVSSYFAGKTDLMSSREFQGIPAGTRSVSMFLSESGLCFPIIGGKTTGWGKEVGMSSEVKMSGFVGMQDSHSIEGGRGSVSDFPASSNSIFLQIFAFGRNSLYSLLSQ